MIVDVHTHTPSHHQVVPHSEMVVNRTWRPDREVAASTTWRDHDQAAQEAGVGVSIIFGIATFSSLEATGIPDGAGDINEATAAFVAEQRGRRIGFFSVHPDEPSAVERAERCRTDLGLRGIKLAPNYQGFDPLGSGALRLFAYAQQHRLPVLLHQGASPIRAAPLRLAHPLLIDEVASRFPKLRIVLAHLAHPWQADAIVVARKHPNVFCDVSAGFYRPWSFYSAMRLAEEWGVLDKLLFGSDYPVATPAEALTGLRSVNNIVRGSGLPLVDERSIEAIIERDALELLQLDQPA